MGGNATRTKPQERVGAKGTRMRYLSVNFERGSQLSVFVDIFRLDFKPAILLG
jgi:hypothetical protein